MFDISAHTEREDIVTEEEPEIYDEIVYENLKENIDSSQFGNLSSQVYDRILENVKLITHIAKRKFYGWRHIISDLISEGTKGLIKAAITFDENKKVKFATYAGRCIENEIWYYLRKERKHDNNISLDDVIKVDDEGNKLTFSDILGTEDDIVSRNIEYKEEVREVLSCFKNLTSLEREVLIKRFGLYGNEAKNQREISDEIGLSKSYISRVEKKGIQKIRKSLGYSVKSPKYTQTIKRGNYNKKRV